MTTSMRPNLSSAALKAAAIEVEDLRSMDWRRVLASLDVDGRVIVDGVRERMTMRWPGVERIEEMREKPMPVEAPVTNQTALLGIEVLGKVIVSLILVLRR